MPARIRLGWTLGVALVIHAGAAGWAFVRAARAVPGTVAVQPMEVDLEIDPPAPPESTLASVEPPAAAPERGAVARLETRPSVAGRAGAVVTEGAQAPVASSEPSSTGTWTFSPTPGGAPSAAGPLAGGALDTAVRAGVGATVAESTKQDENRRRLLPAFSPHDMELGLVPGGVLVTLARDRVRRSRAPVVSHALLEFSTDGAGIVASVRVLDASSGRAEWDEVAAQIAADARATPLRVPSGAAGLSVTLEVSSALKTVNGGTPTDKPLDKALGTLMDPFGAAMDARTPAQRVVAARIVGVKAF